MSISARKISGSSSASKKPNIPSLPPWYSSQRWSMWAVIRPTTWPSRSARKNSALGVLEPRVLLAVEELAALEAKRRHPLRVARPQPEGKLDEGLQVAPCSRPAGWTRPPPLAEPTLPPMSETARAPVDVFEKARNHDRVEQLALAREGDLLPYFRLIDLRGRPGRRDGGPRDDHARLQQLPRPDRRRARQAGRPRGARDLRHRAHRLAPSERHHAASPRPRARARRVDGHRGGDRLHHRPPGQRRLHRHDPRPRATR